jgi:hypothetical protein
MNDYVHGYDNCNDCDCTAPFLDLTDCFIKDIQHLQKEVVRLRYDLSKLLPDPYDGVMIRADIFSDLAGCYYEYPAYQQFIASYYNGVNPLDCFSYCEELKEAAHFREEIYHHFRSPPPDATAVGQSPLPNGGETSFNQEKDSKKPISHVKNPKKPEGDKPAVFTLGSINLVDLSTRLKRRKVTALIADLLGSIKATEELCMSRAHENLHGGCVYCDAENPADFFGNAIENLLDAYSDA